MKDWIQKMRINPSHSPFLQRERYRLTYSLNGSSLPITANLGVSKPRWQRVQYRTRMLLLKMMFALIEI